MISKQELQGRWTEVKGGIREKWGQISDDEFDKVGGNVDQLIGLIERKSGETRRNIESFLEDAVHKGQKMASQAADAVRQYADKASGAAKDTYEQVAANMKQGVDQAQEMVRRRPVESIVVTLGAGMVVGAILGLLIGRSR